MKRQKNKCCGCGLCAAMCPHGAIQMRTDWEGYVYPHTDRKRCTDCGVCHNVCAVENSGVSEREHRCFGVQAKHESDRAESSSGGVFPVLASRVLIEDGVVFGAAMEPDGTVRHRVAQTLEEIEMLRKTKYVQSELYDCYGHILQLVKAGRLVLFVGTPCQCSAVKKYIGEAENLLLADLVCYGVPSPVVWGKYIKELEKRYHGSFESFSFRDKRAKDNGHTVAVRIGGREYTWPIGEDCFCNAYFRNYLLRPSCFSCRFCTTEREESDLTMGDFWGIDKVCPEWDDGMGTSLVIVHSKKGMSLWESVRENFRYFECRDEDILQPRLQNPTAHPGWRREVFFRLCRILTLDTSGRIMRRLVKG